jgi:hypothetical protein
MRTILILFAASILPAQVLDRIAVTVGAEAITETEVLEAVRITALVNREPLNFDPKARREAAERLIDQYLIRRDMRAVRFPEPENTESNKMLAEFKGSHFRGDDEYRAALQRYGVREEQLKEYLLWQLTALRFTDYRFRPEAARPGEPLRQHLEAETDERAEARTRGQEPRTDEPQRPGQAVPATVDNQMDEWLKQTRSRTRIRFRDEAFR